jgi:hypothetical protein
MDEYETVGGNRTGRANRSTQTKPAPLPLCTPQIPRDLTWEWTWTVAVGNRWLTAMARPSTQSFNFSKWSISQSSRFTGGERHKAAMCKGSKQGKSCPGLDHKHGNSSAAIACNKAYQPTGCWTCWRYHCIGRCPFLLRDSQYGAESSRYGPGAVIPLYK